MTDSDDSEDDRMKKVLLAVDTGLLNDKLFATKSESDTNGTTLIAALKSQRHLNTEDEKHASDLQITESMQKFIGKKLSKIIEMNYEFVDSAKLQEQPVKAKKKSIESCLKLLHDFDTPVSQTGECIKSEPKLPQQRPKIQKRNIEPDNIGESEKLRLSSVDFQILDSGDEIKHWAELPCKDKVFEYKRGKGGTLHFVEPKNEFYELKKKNCWSEKYIREKLKKNGIVKK